MMNPDRVRAVIVILAIFAAFNTILVLYLSSLSYAGPACQTPPPCVTKPPALAFYESAGPFISIASWLIFGVTLAYWRRGTSNPVRLSMMKAGFDKSVYDLMVKMRGSGSRLSILQSLVEAPRHRNQLSEITGIDWKEVDRQVGLLEKYGFLSVNAQAGPVKEYKLTEQGRLLVKLMDELVKNQNQTS